MTYEDQSINWDGKRGMLLSLWTAMDGADGLEVLVREQQLAPSMTNSFITFTSDYPALQKVSIALLVFILIGVIGPAQQGA